MYRSYTVLILKSSVLSCGHTLPIVILPEHQRSCNIRELTSTGRQTHEVRIKRMSSAQAVGTFSVRSPFQVLCMLKTCHPINPTSPDRERISPHVARRQHTSNVCELIQTIDVRWCYRARCDTPLTCSFNVIIECKKCPRVVLWISLGYEFVHIFLSFTSSVPVLQGVVSDGSVLSSCLIRTCWSDIMQLLIWKCRLCIVTYVAI